MLKKRIQTLIDLINNTEIEEIDVSSFWCAQKIKLSKSKLNQNHVIVMGISLKFNSHLFNRF